MGSNQSNGRFLTLVWIESKVKANLLTTNLLDAMIFSTLKGIPSMTICFYPTVNFQNTTKDKVLYLGNTVKDESESWKSLF